jgi:chaperonin GroEL
MLTTEVMIADIPEKEPKSPGMPGGGMGDMY